MRTDGPPSPHRGATESSSVPPVSPGRPWQCCPPTSHLPLTATSRDSESETWSERSRHHWQRTELQALRGIKVRNLREDSGTPKTLDHICTPRHYSSPPPHPHTGRIGFRPCCQSREAPGVGTGYDLHWLPPLGSERSERVFLRGVLRVAEGSGPRLCEEASLENLGNGDSDPQRGSRVQPCQHQEEEEGGLRTPWTPGEHYVLRGRLPVNRRSPVWSANTVVPGSAKSPGF